LYLSNSRFNRRAGLSILYFIQGIPQGLVYFALLDWLTSVGFGISDIAIVMSLASLPWTFKILLGPFVDTLKSSKMGKRKPWIFFSLLISSLVFFVSSNYISNELSAISIGLSLFTVILFTSILDVATDGLAIDTLNDDERGISNGLMWASRTIGVSSAAVFASFAINKIGIRETFLFFGFLNLFFSLFILLIRENNSNQLLSFKSTSKIKFSYYQKTIIDLFNMSKAPVFILLMGFCLLSNISFGMHYVSISNLYIVSNNWDNSNLTEIRSFGLYIGAAVAIVGGYLSDRINPYRVIIVSQIMIAFVFLLIALFESSISNFYIGSLLIIIISALSSFLMAASLSLCMGFSKTAVAASQFALLMSIRHFSRIIGEWSAGILDYNDVSLSNLYFVMFLISFLPVITIFRMKKFVNNT
jgi:PAT family beta-lactamase induction signal transducer AmpG